MTAAISEEVIKGVVDLVPDDWMKEHAPFNTTAENRQAYVEYLTRRLEEPRRLLRRRFVPDKFRYDYAVVRVVPKVDREEFINAGVIVSCPELSFLEARIKLNESRLLALDPKVDLDLVRKHLAAIPTICRGGDERRIDRSVTAASTFSLARRPAQHSYSNLSSSYRPLRRSCRSRWNTSSRTMVDAAE